MFKLILPCLLATLVTAATAYAADQPTAAQLIATIKSESASQKDKADACRLLGIYGGKDAVAPLAALLADEKMSHMARYGLEPIPDPAVDAALRDALGKLQGRQLIGVMTSLGMRKDQAAVAPLSKFLTHSDADTAQAAARAIGSIGTPDAAKALKAALPTVSPANQVAFFEGALRCAEALVAKKDNKVAAELYEQIRTLPNTPQQVRTAAIRGRILYGKDSAKVLAQELKDKDYAVFAAAARASQEIKAGSATRALVSALPSLPQDNQILLIQTLGKRADDAAVPALSTAIQTGAKPVKLAALRALAEIGSPSTIPTFTACLADSDRDLSKAAFEGFASLQGKAVDAAIVKMLSGKDAAQRQSAVELIGRRRMTGSLPALLQAAQSSEGPVRTAALRQVGDMGTPAESEAVLALLLTLQGQDLDAAEQTLSALCAKASDAGACVAKISEAMPKANPAAKGALLRVLSSLGGTKALEIVRTSVKSEEPPVRDAAIRVLGTWKTADAAPDLLMLAKETSNPTQKTLVMRSYLALAGNADLAQQQRLAMCKDAAPLAQKAEEKKMLLGALGGINAPAAVELILPHLDDPATRDEAVAAAVGIADRLIKGKNAEKVAGRLVEPLKKIIAVPGANTDQLQRAKALLEQAQAKAK